MAEEQCNNEDLCKDYMILDPKEAGFCDLIRLLYYKNVQERSFVNCFEENNKSVDFERRWLIFISVWAQKTLYAGRKILARTGCVIDTWLNLLPLNDGFIKLLSKSLTGERLVWPDSNSSRYTSVIGNLDPRRDLDPKIKPGDARYNSELSIMAAKVAYENEAYIAETVTQHWEMEYLGYYKFYNAYLEDNRTRAFICQRSNPDLIVVSFKGTSPFSALEWISDCDISWYEFKGVGKAHAGFMKALGLQKPSNSWPKDMPANSPPYAYYTLRKKLKELLDEHNQAKFVVTGHSLGAALAILFVTVLMFHDEEDILKRIEGVYTFGQPRVGDAVFGEYMVRKLEHYHVKYHRYVYCNDMVARLPFDDKALMFKHFGPCFYFSSCYKGKVLGEEPDKNYFSLWWHIPKVVNACWELIRGFILPCRFGPEYKETWVMKLGRLLGLLIPGVTDHIPRDYVNSMRLGLIASGS